MLNTFALLIALIRIRFINSKILFPKYRKGGLCYLLYKQIRYSMVFQFLFYSVMASYYFLGSMDHLLSRGDIISVGDFSNSDNCIVRKWKVIRNSIVFNCGSWLIGFYLLWVIYAIILEQEDWDWNFDRVPQDWVYLAVFVGPAAIMAVLIGVVPIILNPYFIGWPFHPPLCYKRNQSKKDEQKIKEHLASGKSSEKSTSKSSSKERVSSRMLQRKMRMNNDSDIEEGSVTTFSTNWNPNKRHHV
jgi:hypothetical protein